MITVTKNRGICL